MSDHFWLGMTIIFLSGVSNGAFPLPMKYIRVWKWENNWVFFSTLTLIVYPWLLAVNFVPHLSEVYRGVSTAALLAPLIFGFLWGIAQVTFGLGIAAVGMALAFSVVSGLACLFGSLIPMLVLIPSDIFRPRGILLLVSMPILFVGLTLYGMAGRRRENEQPPVAAASAVKLSFMVGLGICIFTGIVGSNINLGFAFSGPVQQKAAAFGASQIAKTYAAWALVLGAGFIPNLLYCCMLLVRNRSWSLFFKPGWIKDAGLSIVMSLLWITAMVGYGIGATVVGKYGTSIGYALLAMASVLSSNTFGIMAGEWKATSSRTRRLLVWAVVAILISVLVLNLGGLF